MGSLSEWLKIMLEEIARKKDDATRAAAEEQHRHLSASVPDNPAGKKT